MAITLSDEIEPYEPFGRSIIDSIPNHKININDHKKKKNKKIKINRKKNKNNPKDVIVDNNDTNGDVIFDDDSNDDDDDSLDPIIDKSNFSFHNNDFITAEIDSSRDLFRSIHDFSSDDDDDKNENEKKQVWDDFWKFRKTLKGEEEIYVKANVLTFSYKPSNNEKNGFNSEINNNGQYHGDNEYSILDKSFTFSENIQDACWCDFLIDTSIKHIVKKFSLDNGNNNYHFSMSFNENQDITFGRIDYGGGDLKKGHLKKLKTICILDRYSIHILSDNGSYYKKPLPFKVKKLFPTNYGLLLERYFERKSPLPILYTLTNPLGELNPVTLSNRKNGFSIGSRFIYQYNTTKNESLNFFGIIKEKNLLIFSCPRTKSHLIFYMRPKDIDNSNSGDNQGCPNSSQQSKLFNTNSNSYFETPGVDEKNRKNLSSSKPNSQHNLISTPVQANEIFNNNKRQQLIGGLSSISRSNHNNNNLFNIMQQPPGSSSSSPLNLILNSPLNSINNNNNPSNNPNSNNNSRNTSLTNFDLNFKGFLASPSLSNLISSRMDSPVSPNLTRPQFFTNNTANNNNNNNSNNLRLSDGLMDFDLFSNSNLDGHDSLNHSSRAFRTPNATNFPSTANQSPFMNCYMAKLPFPFEQSFFEYRQQGLSECTPEYVLDFLWCDQDQNQIPNCSSLIVSDDVIKKIFITCDFSGQNYLCILSSSSNDKDDNDDTIPSGIMKLIKFDQTFQDNGDGDFDNANDKNHEDERPHFVFYNSHKSIVKDVQPLPSLNMIIVLDETNGLVLYSGIHKVAIVHLKLEMANVLGSHDNKFMPKAFNVVNESYVDDNRNLAVEESLKKSTFDDEMSIYSPKLYGSRKKKILHASSPISTNFNNINDKFKTKSKDDEFSINLDDLFTFSSPNINNNNISNKINEISGINVSSRFAKIIQFENSIENRLIIQTTNSKLFKISFPLMASTFLVDKFLSAFRKILPKEIFLNFIIKWYSFRNSMDREEDIPEVILFKLCLFSSIGFDNASIKKYYTMKNKIIPKKTSKASSSNETEMKFGSSASNKKIKIDNNNQDDNDNNNEEDQCNNDDFFELLKEQNISWDKDGNVIDKKASQRANSGRISPTTIVFTKLKCLFRKYNINVDFDNRLNFEDPLCAGFLYPYTPHVLYSIHLIYEDLKLIQMNWPLCKSIVDILYILSLYLQLKKYQDYYYRDFPMICSNISRQIDKDFLNFEDKIIYPWYFQKNSEPPSIYKTLFSLSSKATSRSGINKTKTNDNKEINDEKQIYFPYIGETEFDDFTTNNDNNDKYPRTIVTPNIFNMILLYANLYPDNTEVIDPQFILKPISNDNQQHQQSQQQLFDLSSSNIFYNRKKFNQIIKLYSSDNNDNDDNDDNDNYYKNRPKDPKEKIFLLMSALEITQEYLLKLPLGISLPLWEIIFHFRMNPKNDWCSSLYSLIDRPDLLSLEYQTSFSLKKSPKIFINDNNNSNNTQSYSNNIITGENNFNNNNNNIIDDISSIDELYHLNHSVLRLLFPNDQRLQEAYRLLISSKPMLINIKQEHGTSDSDFVEEQEKYLLALSFRAMALPLGRGMVTLRSYNPTVLERFPIPPLVLHGESPLRHLINFSHIEVPPNMNTWPLFHNGVSAGLRISSSPNRMVDSSWILFNKPLNCSSADDHYAHAGFLLALGLNGLLDNLSIMDLHDYLSKGNDLTKVAILLGLAASRRGTMDFTAFVLVGIHLEGLLPSTSTELDVSPIVRVAAVLGSGLLYQGTGHRYISKVMLNEIGRPPGPEMENYTDRESYALTAGLAFGLVTLGRGNELMNVMTSDGISIPDQLNHYMLGVHKKMSTIQKEKTKTPSYHIREGDCINADVTSPGATLALGMMFFNTGNQAIAQWLNVPDTQNLLEMVRPDFLLLRVLAKNLIMWSEIKPTSQWIESHIPSIIYIHAFHKNTSSETVLDKELMFLDDIDYETMTQSYCNIIAGACFALALKYAGSANDEAFEVVFKYTYKLVTLIQKGNTSQIEQAGRSTIESCVNVLIVSCSIIMAGTGNVEIMRICRFLRSRVNQTHVLYGSFMAIHMALGLLFLGGCTMTLNSSPESVAALICAFFPKYPIHTNDNRYHLQAFRHLYVLASEPRILIPTCIDTGLSLYASIRYKFKDQSLLPVEKMAPCLLPDLNILESVELIDTKFWKISFQSKTNFDKLWNCLRSNGNLYIKRKIECLSYNKEYVYSSSQNDNLNFVLSNWDKKSFTLFDFTNEAILKTFYQFFNIPNSTDEELQMKNRICSILYNCAENEALDLFVPLIKFIFSTSSVINDDGEISFINGDKDFCSKSFRYLLIWQLKMAFNFIGTMASGKKLSKYSMIETLKFKLENHIKNTIDKGQLRNYLNGEIQIDECIEGVIDAMVYYNLPFENFLKEVKETNTLKLIQLFYSFTNCIRSAIFLKNICKS